MRDGLVERRAVMGERAGIESGEVLRGGPARQRVIDEEARRAGDQRLRQGLGLRQERPVIGFQRLLRISACQRAAVGMMSISASFSNRSGWSSARR